MRAVASGQGWGMRNASDIERALGTDALKFGAYREFGLAAGVAEARQAWPILDMVAEAGGLPPLTPTALAIPAEAPPFPTAPHIPIRAQPQPQPGSSMSEKPAVPATELQGIFARLGGTPAPTQEAAPAVQPPS